MSKIQPLYDYVVLRLQPEGEQTTKSGIVTIEKSEGHELDKKLVRAEVLAVGPGGITDYGISIAPGVRPGEVALIPRTAGRTVTIEGETFRVVRAREIAGTIAP